MPKTKRIHKTKKTQQKEVPEQLSLEEEEQQPSKDPALLQQQLLQESQLPDVPMKRSLKCDPRQICNLSEEQRKSIRAQHPEMSEYFFMTQRDKTKYFHVINLQYRQNVKPSQPPGSAPKKKSIHFKKRFEIQHFKRSERCDQLKSLYVASDKQKSKGLKRTPKIT